MNDVTNLSRAAGDVGANLRFIGGPLHGSRCFVAHHDDSMDGALIPDIVHSVPGYGGTRLRVDAAQAQQAASGICRYMKQRLRLVTPGAVLDEVVMLAQSISRPLGMAMLADLTGLSLPETHIFNVRRSSYISYIAWDTKTGTMDVGMKDGAAYRYFNVDQMVVMEFLAADSLGTHYTRHIRPQPSVRLDTVHAALR